MAKAGRPGKWSPELRRQLVVNLTLYSDAEACKRTGISVSTLNTWMRWSEERPEYSGFLEEVQCARANRRDAVLARLAAYHEYKADDCYLKHTVSRDLQEAKKRKADADADYAEAQAAKAKAEAAVAAKVADQAERGQLVFVGVDDMLDMLPAELAEQVEQQLAKREAIRMGWRRDLLPEKGEG